MNTFEYKYKTIIINIYLTYNYSIIVHNWIILINNLLLHNADLFLKLTSQILTVLVCVCLA